MSVIWARPGRCAIVTSAAEPRCSRRPSQRHAEYTGEHQARRRRRPHDRQRPARRGHVPRGMLRQLEQRCQFVRGGPASGWAAGRAGGRRHRAAQGRGVRLRLRQHGRSGRHRHHGPAGAGQQHHLYGAADRAGGRRQLRRRAGSPDRRRRGRLRVERDRQGQPRSPIRGHRQRAAEDPGRGLLRHARPARSPSRHPAGPAAAGPGRDPAGGRRGQPGHLGPGGHRPAPRAAVTRGIGWRPAERPEPDQPGGIEPGVDAGPAARAQPRD